MGTFLLVFASAVFGVLAIIWGLTPEWGKEWGQARNQKEDGKTRVNRIASFCLGLLFLGMGVTGLTIAVLDPSVLSSSGSTSRSAGRLSDSTRQKVYYDMTATQDQNPDSPAWDQAVKEAAANYYDVPMREINNIIREGATEGWLQPDPP